MKKLVGLTVLVLFMSLNINAQQKQERQRKGSEFTPEQSATLMAKKMTLALDLDQNQQSKVYALCKKNTTDRQEQMAEMKKRKESGVKPTNDEKFEMQKNRLDKMISHKADMKNILSKDQFEKWEKMAKSKMRQGNKKMAQKGKAQGNQQGSRNKNKS